MRIRLIGLLTAGLLAGFAYTTSAAARSSACTGPTVDTVIAVNADHGFRNYLLNIGKPYWKRAISPLPKGPYCGSPEARITAAKQAYSAQKRFYVLLMAFPTNPTRAQWNSRFKPLVDSAISCDKLIMEVVGPQDLQTSDLHWLRAVRNLPFGSDVNKIPAG